ncbi:SDR family NAD(P)-dependent oxidoreductase [Hamadaea tsunoensis]|uniref:SDR family NAD(P)-dependent oxidoreductase n=1 Tax=Hamadaea tsunoensis TaxID=53368 RepID=UPI0004019981|nr:SDR family NAD(P)-dependent oxidoreductase [Hamadaea tsunoensis]
MSESRAVLLTGAAGGIGTAVTQALLKRGVTVYAGVRGPAPQLAGAIPVRLDLTDPDSVAAAAQEIDRRQGGRGLHAVINNAGVIVQGPLELLPEAELRRSFEVNVYGPVRVLREFLPQLRQGHGRVVNIGAPAGDVGLPFAALLSASKAALHALNDAVRVELAPWRIPVVQVIPGGTRTEIFAKAATASADVMATVDPEALRRYRSAIEAVAAANARTPLDPVGKVTKAVLAAVLDTRPKARYVVGNARIFDLLTKLPRGTRDRLILRTLGLNKVIVSR